jgi:predicted MFS family arabinose efflux permease
VSQATTSSEASTTVDAPSSGSNYTLWLLIGAIFVVSVDSRVITPILPAIADDLNVSIGRVGLIVTAYLLPYGLFQLVYGPVADRIGHVRVISLTLGAFALGGILCALAPNLPALVGTRFFTGMVAAAVFPLTLAYIGETVAYSERQHAIGYTVMASSIGQVISSGAGGFLAALLSWRAIFALDGTIALVLTVAMLRNRAMPAPPSGPRRSTRAGFELVLRDRRHAFFYAMIFVEGIFTLGAFSFLGAMLRDRDGFSYTAIGLIISLFGLTAIFAGRIIGPLARRIGEARMILFGGFGAAICYGLTVLQPAVVFFPLAMALLGITWIIMHTTLQTRATELAPAARATGISLFAFSLFLGSSAGALITAQSIDRFDYNPTMLGMGLLTLVFALVGSVSIPRWSQPERGLLAEHPRRR